MLIQQLCISVREMSDPWVIVTQTNESGKSKCKDKWLSTNNLSISVSSLNRYFLVFLRREDKMRPRKLPT